MTRFATCLFLLICLMFVSTAAAQEITSPPQAAEELRQHLFDGQVALMSGDTPSALNAVQSAQTLYQDALSAAIADAASEDNERLLAYFAEAERFAQEGNVPALAAIRSQIWTGLLETSSEVVYSAI